MPGTTNFDWPLIEDNEGDKPAAVNDALTEIDADVQSIATTKADSSWVTSQIAAAVSGLLDFKGPIDCSTGPGYPAAQRGDAYFVSDSGKIGGAGGIDVEQKDVVIAGADNAGGDQITVGDDWFVLQGNLMGLGGAAYLNVGTGSGTVAAGDDSRLPTTDEKAALAGTSGTPGSGNKFVTSADERHAPDNVSLSDGATITWDFTGQKIGLASVTLGGNRTLSITNLSNGCMGTLIVRQDATGGRTLAAPASSLVVNSGGGAFALDASANGVTVLSFIYDGTNLYWTVARSFT